MKRLRLDRWASQLQPPRNPRLLHLLQQRRCPFSHQTRPSARKEVVQRRDYQVQDPWQRQPRHALASRRKASSAAAAAAEADETPHEPPPQKQEREALNAPSHTQALHSAKLAALHSRLSLPSKLPLQTLARCLIHPSVDRRPGYNNQPLALLGQDLLGYYTAEWLLCHYPRLPLPILFAAQYAYVGSQTLAALREEWGVEVVAAPGPEVDAGLLQLKRLPPGNAMAEQQDAMRVKDMPQARRLGSGRRNEQWSYRRGMSSRIVYDDQFGDLQTGLPVGDKPPYPGAPISSPSASQKGKGEENANTSTSANNNTTQQTPSDPVTATTVQSASASFIRALTGALYLHAGTPASQNFHTSHILSRHLALHTLFHFSHPTRDLSRLCAREGFEPPVARLISETGRLSRTPVFVVGVFSGEAKLGEGAGSSLNEGRVRAAAAALRGWYLYSPPEGEVMLPSNVEGATGEMGKKWKAQVIDLGEVVT